jgi:hypothetical protein
MEKLKLNLDDLKVESFDPMPMQTDKAKGTVYGYNHTQEVGCNITVDGTCAQHHTCGLCTGQNTCYELCTGGCTVGNGCNNTDNGSTCLCW